VTPKALSPHELEIWHAFKKMGEHVFSRVARDIEEASGLSGSELGVLSRLEDLGKGQLRQQELAVSMGWHKSRLSHQLTRMENRGLLKRSAGKDGGVLVSIAESGTDLLGAARPVHAASVRERLLRRLGPNQAAVILDLFARLSAG
jgi:DNA-binding MarR family transcriptional regulator